LTTSSIAAAATASPLASSAASLAVCTVGATASSAYVLARSRVLSMMSYPKYASAAITPPPMVP
jgi:hypothetical protein